MHRPKYRLLKIIIKEFQMIKSRKMNTLTTKKKQSGVTMIEYALIAALVAIAAILALTDLGSVIATKFTTIGTSITSAGS
jgi:pilus assembly protein Flp/PilA